MTSGHPVTASALPEKTLNRMRRLAVLWMDRRWSIRLHQESNVPAHGPVILASNHIGWLDGPALLLKSSRPVHALVKREMFAGKTGRLLTATAQIPVNRVGSDVAALRTAAESLLAGQMVAIYPEGRRGAGDFKVVKGGVAWLALVSGAPVVPVAIFGTRPVGGDKESKPDKGAAIDIVYGKPVTFPQTEWPRTTQEVASATQIIAAHLREHLVAAQELTGRTLPGPMPKMAAHG